MRFVQKAPWTSVGGGFIVVCFGPWQRSLFLLPVEYQEEEVSVCREFKISPKVEKGVVVNKANQK